MRTLKFLLQKEFKQIFRNPTILKMILVLPIVQLLVIPMAADYEIKNINIAIVDQDHSTASQQLISKITSSRYFKLSSYNSSYVPAFKQLETDEADLIVEIAPNFEQNLIHENQANIAVSINAINGTKANIGATYLSKIITEFNNDIRLKWVKNEKTNPIPSINIEAINWFNKLLNYHIFMVPGILVILITMVGTYMCSLNIVKEKEIGTIEQINVTPIKKLHFILGKLIPFWIIGIVIFTIGLFGVGRLVYGIVPAGSSLLLYAFLGIYLIAVLGIGLLISTYANNQQQAMSLAFFFTMIFLLMSGLFTPIGSMPEWAIWITRFNPVSYFIDVMRMIIMKGSGFNDIKLHFLATLGFAVFFNAWAIINYKKTN